MGKVKVVNNKLNQDLIGQNFTNQASDTIFSFGDFTVTSNFTGRKYTDYSNKLKSFGNSYTLDTLNVGSGDTTLITGITENIVLNLDLSDLKSYVRFGSCSELIRVSLNNVILSYPNSVFINSKIDNGGNITFFDYSYDIITNTSIFYIPSEYIVNLFGFVLDDGNMSLPLDNELKNLNISFDKYCIWSQFVNVDKFFNILQYNGDSNNQNYIRLKCSGNPFNISGITTTGSIDFHIRPIPEVYNKEIKKLKELEKYFLKNRKSDYSGFAFKLKKIVVNDDGEINYNDSIYTWPTNDGFNLDINGSLYSQFINQIITIGDDYDQIKTDLISRMLTTTSLKLSDQTEEKFKKLSRIYGREFDEIKNFIDSIVYINRVSYDKVKNTPDLLIKNLARTLGWDTFTIANSDDLISSIININIDDSDTNPIPAEIDIELWRRIIINSNYYWKSKGTRDAIISILSLVGVPQQFINLNEYIYTVDDKIDVNSVELTLNDLPSSTLPYNSNGYPIAPSEDSLFFFQLSGNTDGGKAYMDNFRNVGFKLNETIDNKKSWPYDGYVQRIDDLNPTYTQNDSKLVLNTKVIDIGLDPSSALEYDVYEYIKNVNYPNSSTNFTIDATFVNLNLEYSGNVNTFILPNTPIGNIDLNFNGVTLLPRISGNSIYDYEVSGNTIILKSGEFAIKDNNDVVTISYLFDQNGVLTSSDITYVVAKPTISNSGTTLTLPSLPSGNVQLSVDGIILTENSDTIVGDFQQNPLNKSELIVLNQTLIQVLNTNPIVLLAYIHNITNTNIVKKNEYHQINSYNSNKFYYSSSLHKYIYKLDNRISAQKNIKVSVNGVVLHPTLDYNLVAVNGYEISFNSDLNLGDIIGVFYSVKNQNGSEAIIKDYFGIGDISKLSFIEFMTLIQKRMINVKNRQTITNNIGGFYPSLLKVYIDYLFSSGVTSSEYSYQLLLEFATKYGRIFDRFIEELIPATTIIRNNNSTSTSGETSNSGSGGITIRNLKFNRQKHRYLRGVNYETNYNGDDGSLFKILQTGITYLCILSATTSINEYWVSTGVSCNLNFNILSPDLGEIFVYNIELSSPSSSYSGVSVNLLNNNDILLNEYQYSGGNFTITGLSTGDYKIKIIDGTSTEVCELIKDISVTGETQCNLSFNLTSPTYNTISINNIIVSNISGDLNSVDIGIYTTGNTLITTIPYSGQSTISYSGLSGDTYKVIINDGTATESCVVEHTINISEFWECLLAFSASSPTYNTINISGVTISNPQTLASNNVVIDLLTTGGTIVYSKYYTGQTLTTFTVSGSTYDVRITDGTSSDSCTLIHRVAVQEYYECLLGFTVTSPTYNTVNVSGITISNPTILTSNNVKIELLSTGGTILQTKYYTGQTLTSFTTSGASYNIRMTDGTATESCIVIHPITVQEYYECLLNFDTYSSTYNTLNVSGITISNSNGDLNSVNIQILTAGNTLITTIPYTGQSSFSYNISGGSYNVKIIDGTATDNCIVTHPITVQEYWECLLAFSASSPTYSAITVNNIIISNPLTLTSSNVKVDVMTTGGTILQTQYYTGQTSISFSGLSASTYNVRITDGTATDSCIVTHQVVVSQGSIDIPCNLDFQVNWVETTVPCTANFNSNWTQ